MAQKLPFEVGDNVVRVGSKGPHGLVQKVRVDTHRNTIKEDGGEPPGITVTVLWDNGTLSHFTPDQLAKQ